MYRPRPPLPYEFDDDDGPITIVAFREDAWFDWLHLVDTSCHEVDIRLPIYPWGKEPPVAENLDLELFVARRLRIIYFIMYHQYVDEMVLHNLEVVDRDEYEFVVRVQFATGEPATTEAPSMGGPTFGYKRGQIFF